MLFALAGGSTLLSLASRALGGKTQLGSAIAAIHREPERRWSVADLALEVGMSRSGFATRFA